MGGKPSKPRITAQDRAILDLKVQRDKLRQYQTKIQDVVTKEVAIAKEQLKLGNKRRALLALKKKKYQETLLDKTDAQIMHLEELTNTIEYALVERQVVEGLKAGNDVLAAIHKETSIDAVQKLMDDTADAIAYQNEIDEIISGKITEEDEAAILEELDKIEREAIQNEADKLPKVPTAELPETVPEETAEETTPEELPVPTAHSIKSKRPQKALEEPMLAS